MAADEKSRIALSVACVIDLHESKSKERTNEASLAARKCAFAEISKACTWLVYLAIALYTKVG